MRPNFLFMFKAGLIITLLLSSFSALSAQVVGPDGAFNYGVPINIPPGTAEMEPQIKLIYNSNCDNGILGVGWQLSGLPCITRDTSYSIGYSCKDQYIGPGGRMCSINILHHTTYHYENESFCRIQASNDNLGDAPAYWIETKPDGTIYYYGSTEDSRILALNADGSTKTYNSQNCTRVWALSKVVDLYGNYYEVEYEQDNGAYYPQKITYTENFGLSAFRTIEFGYDKISRNDFYSGYSSNSLVLTKWRLTSINIKINGTSVRMYSIGYDQNTPTSAAVKSRLTQITDSWNESSLTFTWNNDSTNTWILNPNYTLPEIQTYYGNEIADVNGDSLVDFAYSRKNLIDNSVLKVTYLNTGNGFSTSSNPTYQLPELLFGNIVYPLLPGVLLDINGDGFTDMVDFSTRKIYIHNQSNGWGQNVNYNLPDFVLWDDVFLFEGILADIDGNGLIDFNNSWRNKDKSITSFAYLNTGNGLNSATDFSIPVPFSVKIDLSAGETSEYNNIQFIDINNDGYTDIVSHKVSYTDQLMGLHSWGVYLNLNDTFCYCPDYQLPCALYADKKQIGLLSDLNGDELPDIVVSYKDEDSNIQNYTYLNTGNGWIQETSGIYQAPGLFINTYNNFVRIVDIDGDGMPDWVINRDVYTRTGSIKNHLITNITDYSGSKITVHYTPATQIPGAIDSTCSVFPYVFNPSHKNLVTSITTTDGRELTGDTGVHSYTTTYSYNKGMVYSGHPYEKKDLYFKYIKSQTADGKYTLTYYNQADQNLAGKISKIEDYDSTGNLIKKQEFVYNISHPIVDPLSHCRIENITLILPESETVTTYEKAVYINTKTYTYDTNCGVSDAPSYGNPTRITEHSNDTAIPDKITDICYDIDTNLWVLNLPNEIKVTADGTTQNWQKFTYNAKKKVETTQSWAYNPADGTQKWILEKACLYDDYGNIETITTPNAAGGTSRTVFSYDNDYHTFPISVTDPVGSLYYEYDPATGNKTSETDYNGNKVNYLYDTKYRDRFISIYKPELGWTKKIRYVNWDDVTCRYIETQHRKNSDGSYTYERVYFDGLNRKYKIISTGVQGYDLIRRYEYNVLGTLSKESNMYIEECDTQYYTTINYDNIGRVKEKNYADGTRESWWYSFYKSGSTTDLWKRVRFVDRNGEIHDTYFDSRGNLRRKNDAGIGYIDYGYDAMGRLTYTNDSAGNHTSIIYDTAGRKTQMTDPNTGTIDYAYWDSGQIQSQTDARGVIMNYGYDSANRLVQEWSSDDSVNTFYYYDKGTGQNLEGRLASAVDDNGNTVIETSFSYDPSGNISQYVKSINDKDGSAAKEFAVAMNYDYQGRVTSTAYPDPDHSVVIDHYADAGYLAAVTDDSNNAYVQYSRESCSIDSVERTTGNGVKTTVTYDPRNLRPVTVQTVNTTGTLENIKYYHDNIGNITKLEDLYHQSSPSLKPVDDTETFSYDPISRLLSATAPGLYGTKTYNYSKDGNLLKKDNLPLTYDANHPHAVSSYNGNTYSYDNAGNMVARKGQALTYDAKNRLIEVHENGLLKEKYTYDYTGFRIKKEIFNMSGTAETTAYNINSIYELIKSGSGSTYQFTRYIYGINHEIVAQVSGTTTSIGSIFPVTREMYDWKDFKGFFLKLHAYASAFIEKPENQRYAFIFFFSIFLLFLLGLWIFSAFFRGQGITPVHRWIIHATPVILLAFFSVFGLVGCVGSGGSFSGLAVDGILYFHPNHVGSVKFITDETGQILKDALGNVTGEYRYAPYGELLSGYTSGNSITKYKYTGQEEDSTGLYYMNARFYDPEIGRFITADTIVPNPANSQCFNRYMYANGNPVKYNDPTGHFSWNGWYTNFIVPCYSVYTGINSYPGGIGDYESWVLFWYDNYYKKGVGGDHFRFVDNGSGENGTSQSDMKDDNTTTCKKDTPYDIFVRKFGGIFKDKCADSLMPTIVINGNPINIDKWVSEFSKLPAFGGYPERFDKLSFIQKTVFISAIPLWGLAGGVILAESEAVGATGYAYLRNAEAVNEVLKTTFEITSPWILPKLGLEGDFSPPDTFAGFFSTTVNLAYTNIFE